MKHPITYTPDCRAWPRAIRRLVRRWLPALALLLPACCRLQSAIAATPATQPVLDYAIVVTGRELLAGSIPDAHTSFIARTLLPLGLHCVGSVIVDDDPADIQAALQFARQRASLLIVTGGLGPTDNDVTRQTLAGFTGIALHEHPEVIAQMERRFRTPRDQLRPNLRRQTLVPTRGGYLENPNGTAVGLIFDMEQTVIVALPGPPRELQPMVRDQLVPYLKRRFGTRQQACSLTLRFVGLGQSQISQTLHQNVALPPDLLVSSTFEGGRVDFTFSLPDDSPASHSRLEDLRRQIHKLLGQSIYAEDQTSLEECIARLLSSRRAKLAVAEVGTGGSLTAALNTADTGRQVFAGAHVAPSEDTLRELLSIPEPTWKHATQPAQRLHIIAAAPELARQSCVLVVGPIHSDAAAVSYIEVLFKLAGSEPEIQRFNLRAAGEIDRAGLITQILDHLRRKLLAGSHQAISQPLR